MTNRALSFDSVAGQYAAARPGYPAALFDAVEELTGIPLSGARALDVGAGTGIATRLLRERGVRITAVEPGPGMAAQFRRGLPDAPIVRGTGDALPFAESSVDLVTYAQSWHWTDPARSVPEALRVLRPGGALAVWWNISDHDVPWIAAQDARLRRRAHGGGAQGSADRDRSLPDGLTRRVRWARTVPLDTHLANLGSHSIFRVLGEPEATAFLTEERAHLLDAFPEGMVREAYMIDLAVTFRPPSS